MTVTITELENDNPRRVKPKFEVRCAETNEVRRTYTRIEADAIAAQWEAQDAAIRTTPAASPVTTQPANNSTTRKYRSGNRCVSCGCTADIPTPFGTQCLDCIAMGEL
jgi:hypothetical protein